MDEFFRHDHEEADTRVFLHVNDMSMTYKGETASNAYTRGGEHMSRLRARDLNGSPLWRHCLEQHEGEEQVFSMSVTGTYRNDAMPRQITEAVQINDMEERDRMNDRAE